MTEEYEISLTEILLLRIYDLLAAQLSNENKQLADAILKAHSEGHIFTHTPRFSGRFIADEE